MDCTVVRNLKIEQGGIEDYKVLSRFHYRDSRLGPFEKIFAIRPRIAVIVYNMPAPGLQLRSIICGDLLSGLDRSSRMKLINANIRCIGRVIIEPRYRGLGLASRLVRETIHKMNMPIIEALAVMGKVNPFFEKAGMTAYNAPLPARSKQLLEALSLVGVEENQLLDAQEVHAKIETLPIKSGQRDFIEKQIQQFMQCYGSRRHMTTGLKRTEFVLSKLTDRPVYYVWFNPNLKVTIP
jgi:GNAT superfamily N-acetyltransferase